MNTSETRAPMVRLAAAVMVCNPLLLLSPMFLLYGIYRAVTASALFTDDTSNILFNFIALSVYVLMVCVTATLLARKRINADATMLLLLQGLLFVSPFILIAHGVFINNDIALSLGAGGMAAGLAQLQILRKRLPGNFVSTPLEVGGALILIANFAAPLLFRRGLESNNDTWAASGTYAWNLFLPMLVAWMNLIPTRPSSGAPWTRPWFALLIYFLWLSGTVVQLWTVAYVDDRALHFSQFTVALWVLAWTALRHHAAFSERCADWIHNLAPIAAVVIPVAGALSGLDIEIAAALFTLNLPILWLIRGRLPVLAFSGISVVGALCCMPLDYIHFIFPQADRVQFIGITLGAIFIGAMAFLRDSRAGVLAAFTVGILLARHTGYSAALVFNVAVLFLFLHQLRWEMIRNGERALLLMVGSAWIMHTIALETVNSPDASIPCFVATIVATLALRNASLGFPVSLIPPICSIVVLSIHPARWSAVKISQAPAGFLPILAGFVLLAVGAWYSLRKSEHSRATMDAK